MDTGRHLLHPYALTVADYFAAKGYRTGCSANAPGDNFPFAPQYRGFNEALRHKGGGVGELPDYWGNSYLTTLIF